MTELSTAHSFVVRIYRIDTEDTRNITGLVEAMDGSGECMPFVNADELVALLNRMTFPRKARRRAGKKTDSLTARAG